MYLSINQISQCDINLFSKPNFPLLFPQIPLFLHHSVIPRKVSDAKLCLGHCVGFSLTQKPSSCSSPKSTSNMMCYLVILILITKHRSFLPSLYLLPCTLFAHLISCISLCRTYHTQKFIQIHTYLHSSISNSNLSVYS